MEKQLESQKHRKAKTVLASLVGVGIIVLIIAVVSNGGCGGSKNTSKISEAEAYRVSTKIVESRLTSPSTADFPYSCDYSKMLNDSTYWIKSHVDSQNGFGATVRTTYEIKLTYNGGQWNDPRNWTEYDFQTY